MNPEDLLYPRSKFEVLKTLFYSLRPVPLREIAHRSELVLGSVQSALRNLIKEKIVIRRKIDGRKYYELSDAEVRDAMSLIISALTPNRLQAQASLQQERALTIIPQLEERIRIINHARLSIFS